MRCAIAVGALVVAGCIESSKLDRWLAPEATPGPTTAKSIAPAAPIAAVASAFVVDARFEVPAPSERIAHVARGRAACVVRASGHVDCWGRTGIGRPDPEVRRVPNMTDARAIDPTAQCVLRANGRVACFVARLEFEDIDAENVAVLGPGRCFVHRDGSASCPGRRELPVTDAITVTSTRVTTCVTRKTGDVGCVEDDDPASTPLRPIEGLGKVRRFVMLETYAGINACVILETGKVRCFLLELDVDRYHVVDKHPRYDEPMFGGLDPQRLAGATELVLYEQEPKSGYLKQLVLEVLVGGRVMRWQHEQTLEVLPSLEDAVQLTAGCALRAQGSVVCWGSNEGGALGQPTTIGRVDRPARRVVDLANVTALALAPRRSFALTEDGSIYHWGEGGSARPTKLALPRTMPRVTAIVAHEHGGLCVLADKTAWCRRSDSADFKLAHDGIRSIAMVGAGLYVLRDDGTIAMTPIDDKNRPTDATPPAPAGTIALVSASYNPCAITRDGQVWCIDDAEWKLVPGPAGTSAVAATGIRGCAVRLGAVHCWTDTYDRGFERSPAPAFVDAIDAALTDDRACAVRAKGNVSCWYDNDPATITDVIPAGAIEVALGDGGTSDMRGARNPHGCAILEDRTVACWGSNWHGQLGDGSIGASATPLGVPGL